MEDISNVYRPPGREGGQATKPTFFVLEAEYEFIVSNYKI